MPLMKIIATGGTIANTSHGLISIDEVLKDIPGRGPWQISKSSKQRA